MGLPKFDILKWKAIGFQTIKNIARGLVFQQLWKATGNPDVLLGIIPIYTAQRYEIARSQDKMKYRAVAGQFFAHQRGGHVGVKIVLTLVGAEALTYLSYLQTLHYYGSARDDAFDVGSYTLEAGKAAKDKLASAGSRESARDLAWLNREIHKTFILVTREEIMHHMYIESLIYERDVDLGDAIKVTVMCRQYVPPPKILAIMPITLTPKGAEQSPFYLQGAQVKQAHHMVSFDAKIVDAYVSWETPQKAEVSNMAGLIENALHRAYVRYIGDPLTFIEKSRSSSSRINDGIGNLIGKTFSNIPKVVTSFVAPFQKQTSLETKYKHLLATDYAVGETGEYFVLNSDGNIKFITTISSDDETGTEQTININMDGKKYNVYAKLENQVLKYHHLISKGDTHGPLNGACSTNLCLKSQDDNFYIIFYREDDYNYNIFSYVEPED